MSRPLFVVGALRSDGAQAGLLAGCRRERATVRGQLYKMPSGQPAILTQGEGWVHGELVYDIPERIFSMLDLFKGVSDGLYRRVSGTSICGLRSVGAQLYIMDEPALRGGRHLPKGRWRQPRTG
jgi:gamma-glutamylcyclotransferase (GGCT)/AIG2-like uncharacterized protein YtfP